MLQIDLLKGLAIISVLFLHMTPLGMRRSVFALFHIWQAVPVFVILMGLNGALAFRKKGAATLGELYNFKYLGSRLKRIGIPYLAILMGALALAFIANSLGHAIKVKLSVWTLLGVLPTGGPGAYFVPIVFQFVLVFGLLFRLYLYDPKVMLLTAFVLNLGYELAAPYVPLFSSDLLLYSASVFRYIFAIGLGLWIVDNHDSPPARNLLLLGIALSTLYLAASFMFSYQFPWFRPERGTQNLLAVFWPLLLVMAGLKYLPAQTVSPGVNALASIGRASYHIFLIQILFFRHLKPMVLVEKISADGLHFGIGLSAMAATLSACLLVGLAFMRSDTKFQQSRRS